MIRISLSRMSEISIGRTVKVMVAASALVTATLLAPTPASAAGQPWGPVTAYSGSTPLAKAYGDFAINGGVYATAGINMVDMADNGSPVYVEVAWYYYYKGLWVQAEKKQTFRTERMKYVPTELSHRLASQKDRVRGSIKVCEDRVKALDKCSDPAWVTLDY